jgi:hypothetical protein
MLERRGKSNVRSRTGALAAGLFLALGMPHAGAQNPAPEAAQTAPTPLPPAQAGEGKVGGNPGPFESIGRWLDQGARNFHDHWRGAKARVDDLNDRAAANRKDMNEKAEEMRRGAAEVTIGAVEAVTRLPGTRVMSGREHCEVAPNGAPDCIVAAEALCRKHGFASGKSIDFTSAEECPARALLGDRAAAAECKTVTFISRAMCQ